jgi:hypothetical protein
MVSLGREPQEPGDPPVIEPPEGATDYRCGVSRRDS